MTAHSSLNQRSRSSALLPSRTLRYLKMHIRHPDPNSPTTPNIYPLPPLSSLLETLNYSLQTPPLATVGWRVDSHSIHPRLRITWALSTKRETLPPICHLLLGISLQVKVGRRLQRILLLRIKKWLPPWAPQPSTDRNISKPQRNPSKHKRKDLHIRKNSKLFNKPCKRNFINRTREQRDSLSSRPNQQGRPLRCITIARVYRTYRWSQRVEYQGSARRRGRSLNWPNKWCRCRDL